MRKRKDCFPDGWDEWSGVLPGEWKETYGVGPIDEPVPPPYAAAQLLESASFTDEEKRRLRWIADRALSVGGDAAPDPAVNAMKFIRWLVETGRLEP